MLCACTSPFAQREQIGGLLTARLDWNSLLELADEHRVQGVLANRLAEAGFAGVPAETREKLQSRMRAQHLFTLSMTVELFRILEEFSKAGIETLLVKGPVVSLLAYGDPAVRGYVDLDLLVRHPKILDATKRMVSLGFESDVPENAIAAGKVPGEYLFRRPGTQLLIELHTEHTFRYYPQPMRVDELFARKRQVLLDGRGVPALSLEDEFVLNCIHGAKHFWERLMWVSDIAAIVARHPQIDWRKTQQAARDVGAERMLCVALELGETLLGVKVPAPMAKQVEQDKATPGLCRQVARWLPSAGYAAPSLRDRALFRMRMAGGGIAGVRYLLRLSFSPTDEDWEEGAVERRSWVWDAVRRPFRLMRKYGSDE